MNAFPSAFSSASLAKQNARPQISLLHAHPMGSNVFNPVPLCTEIFEIYIDIPIIFVSYYSHNEQ